MHCKKNQRMGRSVVHSRRGVNGAIILPSELSWSELFKCSWGVGFRTENGCASDFQQSILREGLGDRRPSLAWTEHI